MSCFKRSTSRDFRIDGTTVTAILHGQEVWYECCHGNPSYTSQQDDDEDASSVGSPKAKKMKLSFVSDSTTE